MNSMKPTRNRSFRYQKGEDIELTVDITFQQAAFGTEKMVEYSHAIECSRCEGDKIEPGSKRMTCPDCKGSGILTLKKGPFTTQNPC